ARARFIRMQIELLHNTSRGWFANSDRLCEVARLAGLYADKWLDELPKWAATEGRRHRFGVDDFSRGLLETFRVSPGPVVAHGDPLLGAAAIRRLVVSGLLKRKLSRALLHSPFLLRVRALTLPDADGDLVASLVSTSSTLSNVEELDLSGSRLTDRGAAT